MKTLVSLLVSIAILALIYWRIDPEAVLGALAEADLRWAAACYLLLAPTTLMTAWRLKSMVPGEKGLAYAESIRLTLAGWTPEDGFRHYPKAGLLRVRKDGVHAVVSLRKGGVFKASTADGPFASDTGPVVLDGAGGAYAPARDGGGEAEIGERDGAVTVGLSTTYEKVTNTLLPTPVRFLAFRLLNLTFGRIAPNLLRRLIQHLLINRKKAVPLSLERMLRIDGGGILVEDRLSRTSPDFEVSRLAASTDMTAIFTASSNSWQVSRLLPWTDLDDRVDEFNQTGGLTIERQWKPGGR